MQPGRAQTSGLGVPLLPLARWVGRVAPVCPTHGVLVLSCPSSALCVRGVPGLLAPVHWCARAVCCVGSAVSWATWLLFTDVPARCGALRPSSSPPNFRFFFLMEKKEKQGHAYTAGTGTGSWCGGAIVLCPLVCVVGAVAAVAPQGCGSRVLMYTGMGQGGFG